MGVDGRGASTVVCDDASPATTLPNGIVLDEVWQQRALPAGRADFPAVDWTLGPDSPESGAVVRILTVPPARDRPAPPDLHSDPSLHVITMLDGELDVILETERVTLSPGETIVLRDSQHDLSNRRSVAARFVYTSFPLREEGTSG
ncbi:hypothetical protein ACLQ2Q_19115 [Microbacterium sp. DT81.1]|uniref:hypothetical protein n=1 Tax=Microbacterium sp. DT81.1 TaxID=3393413 RepID=UPI003CFA23AC